MCKNVCIKLKGHKKELVPYTANASTRAMVLTFSERTTKRGQTKLKTQDTRLSASDGACAHQNVSETDPAHGPDDDIVTSGCNLIALVQYFHEIGWICSLGSRSLLQIVLFSSSTRRGQLITNVASTTLLWIKNFVVDQELCHG